jgi:hypothetical protein
MGEFLRTLSFMPNVTVASRAARVSPGKAQEWRKRDEAFGAAWAMAWNMALDAEEREVYERGMLGRDKTISRTKVKRNADGVVIEEETHETTIHEYSDNLLLAHLRAHRPGKWRERGDIRLTGADGGPVQHEVVAAQAALPRSPERLRQIAELAVSLELVPAPVVDIEGEGYEVNGDAP